MAVLRERPYFQCTLLVDLAAEYRNGNHRDNMMKITGANKSTDVTLKRRVIGSLALYRWLDDIRNGNQGAPRNVTIQPQSALGDTASYRPRGCPRALTRFCCPQNALYSVTNVLIPFRVPHLRLGWLHAG